MFLTGGNDLQHPFLFCVRLHHASILLAQAVILPVIRSVSAHIFECPERFCGPLSRDLRGDEGEVPPGREMTPAVHSKAFLARFCRPAWRADQ